MIFQTTTSLPNFEEKPTFDKVQIPDEQGPFDKNNISKEKKLKSKKPVQKPSKP